MTGQEKLRGLIDLIMATAIELGYCTKDEAAAILGGEPIRADALEDALRIASQIRQADVLMEGADTRDFVDYLRGELAAIGQRESLELGCDEDDTPRDVQPRRDYLDVEGARTYFEVHGHGQPVLLLHGGLTPLDLLSGQIAKLATEYEVIAPERPGHGRTPDVDSPITYDLMLDHTVGFMKALGLDRAHVVGWSDGGIIGLHLAARRPELVKSLVAISAPYNFDGNTPEFLDLIRGETPETFHAQAVEIYKALSPDGAEHWPVIFNKMKDMTLAHWGLSQEEVSAIAVPTMICAADNDIVLHDQCAEMHRMIRNSQLCIVPGATHLMPLEETDVLNGLLMRFLGSREE